MDAGIGDAVSGSLSAPGPPSAGPCCLSLRGSANLPVFHKCLFAEHRILQLGRIRRVAPKWRLNSLRLADTGREPSFVNETIQWPG
jgi:hypothetical protein